MDAETTAALHERDVQIEALRRDLARLQARIELWAANGLGVADEGSIFIGYSGAYGTSTRVKRSDA